LKLLNPIALNSYSPILYIGISQNGPSLCGLAVHPFLLCAGLVIANKLHPSKGLNGENMCIYRDCGKNRLQISDHIYVYSI